MKETLFVHMKRTVIQGLMCAPLTAAQDSIDTYTILLKRNVLVSKSMWVKVSSAMLAA